MIITSSYLNLPAEFYEVIQPTPVLRPRLLKFNTSLADSLGIHPAHADVALYAGNMVLPHLTSIALAYAGHQFGHYVPLLGDGRAVVLGEVIDKKGKHWDLQLKGSGQTRFSRQGDGRAPLSAVVREYLISDAMHGLGIPTTRCLAAIASDEKVYRQDGLVPLGVLARVASSHLRIGSFQYAKQESMMHLKSLADYALERHYPSLLEKETPYLEFFYAVLDKQASLIADWMGVGFIHGVMNTDNMSIAGETIDYGPCAFMDEFELNTVFSSIDTHGRYSFGNQPTIAHWNLSQLGQALSPLINQEDVQDALNTFASRFQYHWRRKMKMKLGLEEESPTAINLIADFIRLLQSAKPDFTLTFRLLTEATSCDKAADQFLLLLGQCDEVKQWLQQWRACIEQSTTDLGEIQRQMENVNPAYIPRNHLIEKAIGQCIEKGDTGLMDKLLNVFSNPYNKQPDTDDLQQPPKAHERVTQTFCGT